MRICLRTATKGHPAHAAHRNDAENQRHDASRMPLACWLRRYPKRLEHLVWVAKLGYGRFCCVFLGHALGEKLGVLVFHHLAKLVLRAVRLERLGKF